MAEKEKPRTEGVRAIITEAQGAGALSLPEAQNVLEMLGGISVAQWKGLEEAPGKIGELVRTYKGEKDPAERKKIADRLNKWIARQDKGKKWEDESLRRQALQAHHFMVGELRRPPKRESGKLPSQPPQPPIIEAVATGVPPREPPKPSPENILSGENGPINPRKDPYILTKETARQVLASPDYFLLSRAEQAAIRRVAEVRPARRPLYAPFQETLPVMVLSNFHEVYEKRIEKLTEGGAITLRPDTEEPGEMRVDFIRERLTEKDDLIAAVYDVLMNAVYMRKFALGTESFLQYALGRLRPNKEVYAALTSWEGAIKGLVDFWGKSVKGKGGAGESMVNMIADGTLKLPTELIHFLLTDPQIEIAYHNASTRGLEQLRYKEEVLLEKIEDKVKVMPTVKKQEGKWVARDTVDVAYDMIGELLHGVTLKIRFDWKQAPRDYYIVYKTDQPGLQLSEGKYGHTEFSRLLKRDSKGRVYLVWNNGMSTLWTNANREPLVNKWIELIMSDDPNVYKDERGIAWLISYAGDSIDRRLLDFEALDYEDWLKIEDPRERKKILDIYLNIFREDVNAGGERTARAKHAIRANISRMRTVWHPEILSVSTGGKIDLSKKVPGGPIGVPANEQGFDLDAVRFNPKTKEWEFCLNFNWFFQTRDNEAGAVLGEDISDLATYESYKIAHYNEAVYPTTMASSFKDFSRRPEVIDALLTEDLGKQLYSVPEYREFLRAYLIDQLVRQEMTASLYVERYRGRAMNFLKGVKEKTFYLDWLLNKELHFESCGVRGSWAQAQTSEFQEATPGKKIRMIMQENSNVKIWERFAEENKIDLETLLTFMGVRRLSWEEITSLQKTGELPSELTPELTENYLILDWLNTRKVSHPITNEKKVVQDVNRDNITDGEWFQGLVALLRADWQKPRTAGEKSLAEKLVRLGKLVAPNEDGIWAGELASLLTDEKDKNLAEELRRLQKTIPQDMSADWRILTPWHVMRIPRKLNWDYETDTELFADYEDAVKHTKGDNWFDAGAGVMMADLLKARKRVNKRTWQHIVPLGKYRGHHLFRQWNDDETSPQYGTHLEEPYNQGISLIRNLWGGWWTYQPETGLQERPPFYVEKDMVAFMASLLNTPYRQETAQRLADASYAALVNKKPTEMIPADRQADSWKQLYEARLREEMIVAPGPDWWQAELAVLSFLGLLGVEGKMTIDELPKNEFARWLGIETLRKPNGSGAQKYREYLVNSLNIRRFVPEITNPEQLEKVTKALKEQQAREFKDLEKYATLAPEGLETAAFLGFSLPELGQQYGESPVDNAPQTTNALMGLITPYVAFWGSMALTGTGPLGSSFFFLVAMNTVVPISLARIGWLYGTDVGEESDIHKVPLIKIFGFEALKVSAGSIVRLQKRFPIWKLNLLGLFGVWSKPLAIKREEELEAGKGHDTFIKTGHAAAWIDTWKEQFGD